MHHLLENAMLSEVHYVVAAVVEAQANADCRDNAVTSHDSAESFVAFGSFLG